MSADYPPATDTEFERVGIKAVTDEGDGKYGVERVDGWHLLVGPSEIVPEPGDVMRCYGRGIGHQVRGIVIDGKGTVRYQTDAEMRERWRQQQLDRDAEKQRKLEEERPARDLRIRELPRALRLRIQRFQASRGDWRRDHEPYELFVCEEATKIAAHFEGANAVFRLNQWAALPHEKQAAEFSLSDQHSGNTYGMAVQLARLLLLENEEHVIRAHGALCPLVGCDEYGCYVAEAEVTP